MKIDDEYSCISYINTKNNYDVHKLLEFILNSSYDYFTQD